MAYPTEQEWRPILNDLSTTKQLSEGIDWIQERLQDLLKTEVRRISICARSKPWWNEDIRKKRRDVSRAERLRKRGVPGWKETIWKSKAILSKAIRKAKREKWTEYLEAAAGKEVWAVMRYIGPARSNTVPTISHQGVTAECLEEKTKMLKEISFPSPVPYLED